MEIEVDEDEIGETPIIELSGLGIPDSVNIYAKVEWFNLHSTPYGGGSVKSRPALYMIDRAEKAGELTEEKTIIEPTSGNTGSEISKIARNRGYEVLIVMPDNAGEGKIKTVRETGAEIEFTDAMEGYDAVIERAHEILDENPEKYYMPNQYENPANPLAHEETTAPEIWQQTDGRVSHFIAGAGTGGTITGVSRGLKKRGDVTTVAMEPDSALHAIDGLKYMREEGHLVPQIYDENSFDEKIYVSTDDAYDKARELKERYSDEDPRLVDPGQYDEETVEKVIRVDGHFLVGTSSAANLVASIKIAQKIEEGNVVTMFCDKGDKYRESLWREYFENRE